MSWNNDQNDCLEEISVIMHEQTGGSRSSQRLVVLVNNFMFG